MAKPGPRTTPLTEREWIDRLARVIPNGNGRGKNDRDWVPLFVEFIRSTPEQYRSLKAFCVVKGIPYHGIQERGGATLWNQARKSVSAQAMVKAIGRSVDFKANKYEKEIEVSYRIIELADRQVKRLLRDTAPLPDGTDPEMNPFLASATKTLAETMKLLAETNLKLLGDLRDVTGPVNVNLDIHGLMVKALTQRDKDFGVIDAEADPG